MNAPHSVRMIEGSSPAPLSPPGGNPHDGSAWHQHRAAVPLSLVREDEPLNIDAVAFATLYSAVVTLQGEVKRLTRKVSDLEGRECV